MINPIISQIEAIYACNTNPACMPDIQSPGRRKPGQRQNTSPLPVETRRPETEELDVYQFPQWWASSALGFGGIGTSAMTKASTTVVIHQGNGAVFFDGRHAYTLPVTKPFLADMGSHNMASVDEAPSRYAL